MFQYLPALGAGLENMAKKEKQDVLVSYKFLPIFEALIKKGKAQAAAELTVAILRYDMDGTEPQFSDDSVEFVWETVIRPKLDENKTAYQKVVSARKEAGRSGGLKKAENVANVPNATKSNQMVANVPDYDDDYDNDNDKSLSKEKSTKKEKTDFDLFWDEYPRKKGIGAARKAFEKAITKTDIQTILEAVRKQKTGGQWMRDNGQYIPYPSTWLNQERWGDEPDLTPADNSVQPRPKYDPHAKNDVQAGYQGAMEILEGLITDE